MSGIDPALADTTAATLVLHGGLLQRVIDIGFETSTMALSEAGIKLGEFPVVKQIGKRDKTDVGMEMDFGSERNVGARTPIVTPKSQMVEPNPHPVHKLLIVRTTSLHAYTCLRTSLGSESTKSALSSAHGKNTHKNHD